jgi:hypothetical protein
VVSCKHHAAAVLLPRRIPKVLLVQGTERIAFNRCESDLHVTVHEVHLNTIRTFGGELFGNVERRRRPSVCVQLLHFVQRSHNGVVIIFK